MLFVIHEPLSSMYTGRDEQQYVDFVVLIFWLQIWSAHYT